MAFVFRGLGGFMEQVREVEHTPEEMTFARYVDEVNLFLDRRVANELYMRRIEENARIGERGAANFRQTFIAMLGHSSCLNNGVTHEFCLQIAKAIEGMDHDEMRAMRQGY